MNDRRSNQRIANYFRWLYRLNLLAVWGLFLLSFMLPVCDRLQEPGTWPGTPLTGWQAFEVMLESWGSFWLTLGAPWTLIVFPVLMLVTGAMAIAPLFYLRPCEGIWLFFPLYFTGGLLGLFLPTEMIGKVFIGYYVWVSTMFGMGLLALISGALSQSNDSELIGQGE